MAAVDFSTGYHSMKVIRDVHTQYQLAASELHLHSLLITKLPVRLSKKLMVWHPG